jgi:hypothetical protein
MEKMRKRKREKDAVEAERKAQATVHREAKKAFLKRTVKIRREQERDHQIRRDELDLR